LISFFHHRIHARSFTNSALCPFSVSLCEEDFVKKTPKKKRKSEHLLEGFMAAKRTDDKRSATPSTQLRASACW
jgi:hypothetical protein